MIEYQRLKSFPLVSRRKLGLQLKCKNIIVIINLILTNLIQSTIVVPNIVWKLQVWILCHVACSPLSLQDCW